MTDLRPRKVAHKGRIEAAGFLFNADLIGVAETRRRILNLWESGVQVYSSGPNYFIRLPSTIRVDCARAVATPLVQIEGLLSGIPLSLDELDQLQSPVHSVVFAKGGVAQLTHLSPTIAESPETWIDVAAYAMRKVESLGAAFAEPKVVGEAQPFDARAKLDGVPAEASELREALAAIKSVASERGEHANDSRVTDRLRIWLGGLIGSLASAIQKLARMKESSNRAYTKQSHTTGEQGTFSKAHEWLTRLGLRFLHASRLAQVLGRRQAAYLRKMMDMFERGDLIEALKHAIPLNDLASLDQGPALGVPKPRDTLSIQPWRQRSSRRIGLGEDVMSYLQQLYRASFDRLVAQRRIEEAAFVLAELLQMNAQAVALLERHQKLKLAAELAEARELPPDVVVRQWFIAGDIERAIAIARRTQSFAAAVVRLEKGNKEQAEQLRVIWAESLAEGGNYAGAVDVIWPIRSQRSRACEWMDSAIEVGGPVAARMLARKVAVVPEDFENIRRRALIFLDDESYEQQETRASFAEALATGDHTKEAQVLARVTARAVLRDAGQTASSLAAKQFKRLVNFSGDGPLRTDLPPFPVESKQRVPSLFSEGYSAGDRGSMAVHDAVLLPNGRMLVALGEVGARLLTRDGRTITHLDQPAEKLVI